MERYVVLGLARARADWFRAIGQWATAAVLPAEFVRCVSIEELRTRLRSGRPFSAAVVDGNLPGVDRDLMALANDASVSVIVVDEERVRDWRELGAAAVITARFSRDELLEVLMATAAPVGQAVLPLSGPELGLPPARGRLVAVTGPGGTGASSVASALAQGLAAAGDARVLLADLCRNADQAMLHDTRVVVPGVQELVDAHRTGTPSSEAVIGHTFDVSVRGYRLLIGIRRARQWVVLPPQALERSIDTLLRDFDLVVADVEPDLEGASETGSTDIEDRNRMARATVQRADVIVAVGDASMKGLFALTRLIEDLHGFGMPLARVLPVVTTAPRRPHLRAGVVRALHDLLEAGIGTAADELGATLQLRPRNLDAAFRDGTPLPSAIATPLARAVGAVQARVGDREPAASPAPVRVVPGTLTSWTESET